MVSSATVGGFEQALSLRKDVNERTSEKEISWVRRTHAKYTGRRRGKNKARMISGKLTGTGERKGKRVHRNRKLLSGRLTSKIRAWELRDHTERIAASDAPSNPLETENNRRPANSEHKTKNHSGHV